MTTGRTTGSATTGSATAMPETSARWTITLVGVVAFLAALAGLDARATYGARVTADEPQYLLTAQSLADDRSLDIGDEIAEQAYLAYHEIPIDRQTRVLEGGREVSPHDPLLPVLLAPAMAVGGWVLAKLTLALLGAATAALGTWLAIRRFGVAPPAAGVTLGAAFVALPLAAYGTQVYPEVPAALAALVAIAAVTAPDIDRRRAFAATLAIVALPWLAVKYAPVAAVLGMALLVVLADHRRRIAASSWFALHGLAFLALHRVWYGGWTAYSSGDHFEETGEFSVVGTQVDLLGRSRRIVGLLVDREFGIAAWSPIWLLLPIAAAVLVRRRPRWWWLWVSLVAVGWLNATFVALTMHGWWVPGRQLVVVLPVAAIGIAWLVGRHPALARLAVAAGALGAANWIWLAAEASTDRRTLVVDFMHTAALPYRVWSPVLPSGLDATSGDDLLLAGWSIVLVAVAVVSWWWGGVSDPPTPSRASRAAPLR